MLTKFLKLFKITFFILVFLYVSICALLYCYQDDLLFHPQPKTLLQINDSNLKPLHFKIISFKMKDAVTVSGFISTDSNLKKQPLVIYFGGNAEEVSHLIDYKNYFLSKKILLINYRGFGLSEGKPSEKNMFSDALEIFDCMKKDNATDTTRMYIIGRSIGTGVATYLSSKRHVKATVLITPYESMIKVAQEKYSFIPMAWLINHPFNSEKYAQDIKTPLLALIAKQDAVIPTHHAHALLKKWKGATQCYESNSNHNTIMNDELMWQNISRFCNE